MKAIEYDNACRRLAQATSLLCNIGLSLIVRRDTDGTPVWILQYHDEPFGAVMGCDYYKHERSLMRRAWRLYRWREEGRDLAHEADMAALAREQLRGEDFSEEETAHIPWDDPWEDYGR